MRAHGHHVWLAWSVACWLVAAPAGAAVTCDGVDDELRTALSAATFLSPSAFTLMAYVKSTGATFESDEACWQDAPVLTNFDGNITLGRHGTTGTGAACVEYYDPNHQILSVPLSPGWHHLAARLLSGTLELFVDGVSVAAQSGGSGGDLSGALRICGSITLDAFSPDTLVDIKVYNVGLPTGEIETLGRSKLQYPGRTTPTGYWPLDDCAEGSSPPSEFRDRSGFSRHLTSVSNGPGLTCRASEFLSGQWGPH